METGRKGGGDKVAGKVGHCHMICLHLSPTPAQSSSELGSPLSCPVGLHLPLWDWAEGVERGWAYGDGVGCRWGSSWLCGVGLRKSLF